MARSTFLLAVVACCACGRGAASSAPRCPDPPPRGALLTAEEAPAVAPGPSAVHRSHAAERRRAPSGTATVTVLSRGQNAFVARLSIAPGAKIPEHRDATEEVIHVLAGRGTITIDGTTHEIGPGDTVYMAPNARVSFENGPDPMEAIQVFAGPEPAAKYDGWTELEPDAPDEATGASSDTR